MFSFLSELRHLFFLFILVSILISILARIFFVTFFSFSLIQFFNLRIKSRNVLFIEVKTLCLIPLVIFFPQTSKLKRLKQKKRKNFPISSFISKIFEVYKRKLKLRKVRVSLEERKRLWNYFLLFSKNTVLFSNC